MRLGELDLNLKPCEPYLKFWTGHSQTLIGHLIPSDDLFFRPETTTIDLSDGDQLFVSFYQGSQPFTLSLYHGLGGSAQADYMRRSANIAFQMGWNVVLVNHRGVVQPTATGKTYHSGRGEDAETVLRWARQRFSQSKQVALGFSMSGSILLNLLTRQHGQEQPDFAVVVNAPLNLDSASQLLSTGFSKIYDYRFYLMLKKMILDFQTESSAVKLPLAHLPVLAPTRYIDEVYTSKANGFFNALDYYQRCSTWKYLDQIQTPTFVLTAADDPFIDVQDYHRARWSHAVNLTVQQYGGHMGYYAKQTRPWAGFRWLDYYLRTIFQKIVEL